MYVYNLENGYTISSAYTFRHEKYGENVSKLHADAFNLLAYMLSD